MTNANEPAMPTVVQYDGEMQREHQVGSTLFQQYGLTKREHFAAMAMQGFCAHYGPNVITSEEYHAEAGRCAVVIADALIKALNQPLK